jgi:two-component system, OmpR family, sensor kinase
MTAALVGAEPTARWPPTRRPAASPTGSPGWRGALGSIRGRVLLAFVLLLAFSAALSLVAARQVLILRLEARLDAAMSQEVAELERLLDDGRDPQTGQPFTSIADVFDIFLARNVPSVEEALLSFVDGDLHQASLDQFPLQQIPGEVLDRWAAASVGDPTGTDTGTYETARGKASYRLHSFWFQGQAAAFTVTILPAAEMRELDALLTWGVAAAAGVLLLSTACAWPVAGRALAPVREVTATARAISESDLTRRIAASGRGDAAEMAGSFNAMLDRLEAVFRSQRRFVEDASHELRDPLTIVRGHLEVLEHDPVLRAATVEMLLDEVDRMSRIVADLQVLADVDQPDFLRLGLLDLRAFTRELLAKVSMLGERTWQVDAEAGAFVVADRHRLTEAVINLAHNAVQHTGPGDTIALGTGVDGERWSLWVRDTGVGLAEQDRERVFERFTRGTGAHRRYQGAGLGLSIVTAVAQAHGGGVEVDSRLGHGARFTLHLPTQPQVDVR